MMLHEPITGSQRAKLTVDDFLTLSEKGAFDGYAKSELIEGEIWLVNAIHRRHARHMPLLSASSLQRSKR